LPSRAQSTYTALLRTASSAAAHVNENLAAARSSARTTSLVNRLPA
jgi:hypothetical protein